MDAEGCFQRSIQQMLDHLYGRRRPRHLMLNFWSHFVFLMVWVVARWLSCCAHTLVWWGKIQHTTGPRPEGRPQSCETTTAQAQAPRSMGFRTRFAHRHCGGVIICWIKHDSRTFGPHHRRCYQWMPAKRCSSTRHPSGVRWQHRKGAQELIQPDICSFFNPA